MFDDDIKIAPRHLVNENSGVREIRECLTAIVSGFVCTSHGHKCHYIFYFLLYSYSEKTLQMQIYVNTMHTCVDLCGLPQGFGYLCNCIRDGIGSEKRPSIFEIRNIVSIFCHLYVSL